MANFIINSTSTSAIRKEAVVALNINEVTKGSPPSSVFELTVKVHREHFNNIVFEVDTTLEGIQAKAATLLAALEE